MGNEIKVSEGMIGTYTNEVNSMLMEEGLEIFVSGLGGRRVNHMCTGDNLSLRIHRSTYLFQVPGQKLSFLQCQGHKLCIWFSLSESSSGQIKDRHPGLDLNPQTSLCGSSFNSTFLREIVTPLCKL